MRSLAELRPSSLVPKEILLVRAGVPSPELNRYFYTAVGGDWYWIDRLKWTWSQWHAWLDRPELETWIAHVAGTPAGYFELELQAGNTVELVSFGLLPNFYGQGLGGYLLTQAIHRAWHLRNGVSRVWLHTCTLDHPGALGNYRARGFTVFKEEESMVELPDQPPGSWPGAERPR
jgi:GNAT superfamily N-acetyltransferase